MLAHGQFGNWCIQHICEHGAPHDRSRAIEHILLRAVDYSMDQFASKIVEKCLKIGGSEFLDRYLSRVCTGRADRPRMPLIDSKLNVPVPNLYFLLSFTFCCCYATVIPQQLGAHFSTVAGDQYGNYLIQWISMNAAPHQRELVASHIRYYLLPLLTNHHVS